MRMASVGQCFRQVVHPVQRDRSRDTECSYEFIAPVSPFPAVSVGDDPIPMLCRNGGDEMIQKVLTQVPYTRSYAQGEHAQEYGPFGARIPVLIAVRRAKLSFAREIHRRNTGPRGTYSGFDRRQASKTVIVMVVPSPTTDSIFISSV